MAASVNPITLRRPDDWHVHLRDGAMLAAVLPFTARQFARAIIMPNLVPPVTTVAAAAAYRERIRGGLPAGRRVRAADDLLPDRRRPIPTEIARGYEEGVFAAVKLYPAHATTNSAHGVTDHRPHHAGARGDGEARHAAAGPWRGDRSRGRHLRPRGGVHRPGAGAAAPAPSRAEDRAGAHHDRGGGRIRRSARPEPGGDDHAASPDHQPQRDLQRRHPAASLLPADRQARGAPPGAAPGRDLGRPAILPRHRHRAAHRCTTKECACGCAGIFNAPVRAARSMPRSSRRRARSTGSRPSPR